MNIHSPCLAICSELCSSMLRTQLPPHSTQTQDASTGQTKNALVVSRL